MKFKFDEYVIRDWRRNDIPSLVKYANNRKIAMYLRDGFAHPYLRTNAEAFLEMVEQQKPRTFFAIATATEAIGSIGISLGADVHRFTAELGYWLAEPFWNRGITTQAVKAITAWGFATFNLNRMSATPYLTNSASARVLEKAGYQREGIMRSSVVKEGQVLGQFLYAKTREET